MVMGDIEEEEEGGGAITLDMSGRLDVDGFDRFCSSSAAGDAR